MLINIQDIYDLLSKYYQRHSSLFLTREAKRKDAYFYNFSCPQNVRQLVDAMNAMAKSGEAEIKSLDAKLYSKNISAFRCDEYMVKVTEHESANSLYISINFYGITGISVKKAYGKYEAKLTYNPGHLLSIYINAKNGDMYGKGVIRSGNLYPMSFSTYVNKLLLHSEIFRKVFADLLMLCANGHNIIKDIARTIEEEGYVAMPITIFDIKKYRTKNELIRGFTGVDIPVDFNKRSLNHGYLLAEFSKKIPPEQIGYMIQMSKEMVVNTLRTIYKEVYPLNDFVHEFIARYYIEKLGVQRLAWESMLVHDYIELARDHGFPISINFKSINRLEREHNRLADYYDYYDEEEMSEEMGRALVVEDTEFSELRMLLPNEFEWITTTNRLKKEGVKQRNCVFSYRDKVRSDLSTIYHWSIDGRTYTIEFGRTSNGKFTIEQMLQYRNGSALKEDIEYVERCLGSKLGKCSATEYRRGPYYFNVPGNFAIDEDVPF